MKFGLWGLSFKPETDDVRESPALDIIALLQQMGAEVLYVDPYVLSIRADGIEMKRKENVKCENVHGQNT